jgi:hypothetical protein
MKIQKFKYIQIFSNGSINFSYQILNSNYYSFLLKDHKNYTANLKNLKHTEKNENFGINYKKKYFT